jgi:conjugal transfer/entry exclusion protein
VLRAALWVVPLMVAPSIAGAQWAVFDAANLHQNVLQYARAVEALAAELRALQKLSGPRWRTVTGVVSAADAALPAGAVGAAPQATRDYPDVERSTTTSTLASLAGALAGADLQRSSLTAGTAQLDAIKGQLAGVQGTQGVLELSSTVHVFTAEELVLLRQAIVAQTNVASVYYGNEVTTRAQSDEDARALYQGMASPALRRAVVSLRP